MVYYPSANNQWDLRLQGGYLYWTEYKPTQQNILVSKSMIPDNEWTYVSVVHDIDNGLLSFYLNGILDSTSAITLGLEAGDYGTSVGVGGRAWTSMPSGVYRGDMDEFAMWNRALTADEIAKRYSTPLSGSESGLMTYYDFSVEGTRSARRFEYDTFDIEASDDLNLSIEDFTIVFDVKFDDPASTSALMCTENSTDGHFHFGRNSSGWFWGGDTRSTSFDDPASSLEANKWYNIVLIHKDGQLSLYRDGVKIGSSWVTGEAYNPIDGLSLGDGYWSGTNHYSFYGDFDEFSIIKEAVELENLNGIVSGAIKSTDYTTCILNYTFEPTKGMQILMVRIIL